MFEKNKPLVLHKNRKISCSVIFSKVLKSSSYCSHSDWDYSRKSTNFCKLFSNICLVLSILFLLSGSLRILCCTTAQTYGLLGVVASVMLSGDTQPPELPHFISILPMGQATSPASVTDSACLCHWQSWFLLHRATCCTGVVVPLIGKSKHDKHKKCLWIARYDSYLRHIGSTQDCRICEALVNPSPELLHALHTDDGTQAAQDSVA